MPSWCMCAGVGVRPAVVYTDEELEMMKKMEQANQLVLKVCVCAQCTFVCIDSCGM